MCRYYMSDHKSSWVLASQIHPILIIRRPSNQTNPHYTEHTQSGVCASSATREEWEEFERVNLCLHMQVHHIDSLINPYSVVCLSLSLRSYYARFIFPCTVLCSVYFYCPFWHQSPQLGCNKHRNSDSWSVKHWLMLVIDRLYRMRNVSAWFSLTIRTCFPTFPWGVCSSGVSRWIRMQNI